MELHGGDMVAKVLSAQGVKVVFCLCGGHISPILVGCKRAGIHVLDARHEATAVFAADAGSRITGVPGMAVVTAGPGVTNTVTAVKNARMAQSPIVLIGGAAPTVLKGRGALQDMDPGPLMATVAKASLSIRRNCDVRPVLQKAFSIAGEGVPGPVPDANLVKKVAGLLERVHSAVMVLGSQSMLSPERVGELVDAVDQLGMPVFLTGTARGLLGEDHQLQIRHYRKDVLKHADLVILAGMPCDFRMDYGRVLGRKTCLVAANRSKHDLNLNRKPDVALHADPFLFIVALACETAACERNRWIDWCHSLKKTDGQREAEIDALAAVSGQYVNPVLINLWIDTTDFRKGSISM